MAHQMAGVRRTGTAALTASRWVCRAAVAAGLGGSVVAIVLGWDFGSQLAGWLVMAGAALVGAVGWAVRFRCAERGTGGRSSVVVAVALALVGWGMAAAVTVTVDAGVHQYQWDHRAVRKVAATVSGCQDVDGGSSVSFSCTYRYVVDDLEYSGTDWASQRWPDGHRLTVRIDPAHPETMVAQGHQDWGEWIFVPLLLLGEGFALRLWWWIDSSIEQPKRR